MLRTTGVADRVMAYHNLVVGIYVRDQLLLNLLQDAIVCPSKLLEPRTHLWFRALALRTICEIVGVDVDERPGLAIGLEGL